MRGCYPEFELFDGEWKDVIHPSEEYVMIGILLSSALATGQIDQPAVLLSKVGGQTSIRLETGLQVHRTRGAVANAKAMRLPGSTTQVVTWTETTRGGKSTPYYAISLDGKTVQRVTSTSYDVDLKFAKFDPVGDDPSMDARLKADESNELFIVQFPTQPLEEYREAVTAAGGVIRGFAPNNGLLVELDDVAKARVEALAFVRAVADYHPAYRAEQWIHDQLRAGTLETRHYNVQLTENSPTCKARAAALVDMLGGQVQYIVPEQNFMTVTLDPTQLVQFLRSNDVLFVDRWGAPGQDMDNIRIVNGIVTLNANPGLNLGLRGQGIVGAVMDGGLRTTHLAFLATGRAPILQNTVANDSHGTATYGINFGDGDGNVSGLGMMPEAQGVFAAYSGYLGAPTTPSRYALTQDLLNRGAIYQSNSWGDPQTSAYTNISAQMDGILFDLDISILQSQSNTGNTNSRPQAWAKNIISVGANNHFNNTNTADDRWNNGASVGPAADGRIKPDLAQAYDSTLTTTSSSDTAYTTSFGGTSGATPITAGALGILTQMWGLGYFGQTNLGNSHFANRPKAALAKAIAINTARQWQMAGTDLTRVRQGWGMLHLLDAYNLRRNMFFVNETQPLNNLQSVTYRLHVPSGTPEFKATMVFRDPAPTVSFTPTRINNLSLRVTSPSGAVYWGNAGLGIGQGMVSTTGGTENTVDTVENVILPTPEAGTWTVEVIGAEVIADTAPATAGTNAVFALAVSGVQHSIAPTTFSVPTGTPVSGGLTALDLSDNARMSIGEPTAAETVDAARQLIVETIVPTTSLTSLRLRTELNMGLALGSVRTEFFNWNTNSWTFIGSVANNYLSDNLFIAGVPSPNTYIRTSDRRVRARLTFFDSNPANDLAFNANVDQIRFDVNP